MNNLISRWQERIRKAAAAQEPLRLRGGGTKDFYGESLVGELFDTTEYRGIVSYEPTELVITARCGTPLIEIEETLRARGQMLAFEPPHFGPTATLGGCIASGLSGPRRPYVGAVRDFVLGVRMLDGRGDDLRFGGQVMKNVAGFDVSRLMVGAMGTLGIVLEASLKVLPLPQAELTLHYAFKESEAIERINQWSGWSLPISASAYVDGGLRVRLSGAESALTAARAKLGGERVDETGEWWRGLREHELSFFRNAETLWRLSVKPTAQYAEWGGAQALEWGGALRWIETSDGESLRRWALEQGGHATLFRAHEKTRPVFQLSTEPLMTIHRRLKETFDPNAIFNRSRLWVEDQPSAT